MYAAMPREDHDARIRRFSALINQQAEVSREMLVELSAGILSILLEGAGTAADALSMVFGRQDACFSNLYTLYNHRHV
jgi:hypothetical protein